LNFILLPVFQDVTPKSGSPNRSRSVGAAVEMPPEPRLRRSRDVQI